MRENDEFMNLFIENKKDEKMVDKMLQMIMESNTIYQTKKIAENYQKIALRHIDEL